MKNVCFYVFSSILFLIFSGCVQQRDNDLLSSAVIESETCDLSAVSRGKIISILKHEGDSVNKQEVCAIIDTIPLRFKLEELEARVGELNNIIASKNAEVKSIKAKTNGTAREFGRISDLVEKGSAPEQKKDQLNTELKALDSRVKASEYLKSSLSYKKNALLAKKKALLHRLKNCYITSPIKGIVTTRYKSEGETAMPGASILTVAQNDTMYADCFIPQYFLSEIKYNETLYIRFDSKNRPEHEKYIPAVVTWISSRAEFAPQNIETRENRNVLVFRVRVTAPNPEGILKQGLPVEIHTEKHE